jgi:hypothetical protein
MINFFKKAKADIETLHPPIEINELSSAWQASDGKLFGTEKEATQYQERENAKRIYRRFLAPYFRGAFCEVKNFDDTIDLFMEWERYVEKQINKEKNT